MNCAVLTELSAALIQFGEKLRDISFTLEPEPVAAGGVGDTQSIAEMSSQQLREMLYPSPVVEWLQSTAEHHQAYRMLFRRRANEQGESSTILLRILAFLRRGPESFEPFNRNIDGFVEAEMKFWAEEFKSYPVRAGSKLTELTDEFDRAVNLTLEILGVEAVSKTLSTIGAPSIPLAEVVIYQISRRDPAWLREQKDKARLAFWLLVESKQFRGLLGSSTSHYRLVLQRFHLMDQMFDGVNTLELPVEPLQVSRIVGVVRDLPQMAHQYLEQAREQAREGPVFCYRCDRQFQYQELMSGSDLNIEIDLERGFLMHSEEICRAHLEVARS